jgi:two-component system sensor histidine kinase PilS (NtrC family)
MGGFNKSKENDFGQKLKWLMLFRLLAALLILGGTIIFGAHEDLPFSAKPFIHLYWLSGWIILLSLCYTIVYPMFKRETFFAYLQIVIDTLIVTAVIFLTGSYSSLFTFLYLIVIICASMYLSKKGSMIISGLCCLEYGVMVDLEYFEVIRPVFLQKGFVYENYDWNQILYKLCTVMMACFLTMVLSSYLAEKERRAKRDLLAMEDHVKRVERMALIGEMAAGLAHEIKNPLASLSGSIQMLMEVGDDCGNHDGSSGMEKNKLMAIAVREADRLNSLVSDFLLFARPVTGTPKVFDIGDVINDTVTLFMHHDRFKNRIDVCWDGIKRLDVEMDPGHLKQILQNLLINAADAIGDVKGTITVKTWRDVDGHFKLSVRDSGCGMESKLIKNIFDPFFTTKSKGTGLGLSIVLRIVESYNGQIDVESEKGEGSEFTVKI